MGEANEDNFEEDAKMTRSEQAVSGLDFAMTANLVCVRDGQDTWICTRHAWDAAMEQLDAAAADERDEGGVEAYRALCTATAGSGLIASIIGTSRGDSVALVRDAYAAGLIDADLVASFGVEISRALLDSERAAICANACGEHVVCDDRDSALEIARGACDASDDWSAEAEVEAATIAMAAWRGSR
jgi:hypothetical protein